MDDSLNIVQKLYEEGKIDASFGGGFETVSAMGMLTIKNIIVFTAAPASRAYRAGAAGIRDNPIPHHIRISPK